MKKVRGVYTLNEDYLSIPKAKVAKGTFPEKSQVLKIKKFYFGF